MVWSSLGTQFCLELAFGVLVSMAAVARAPLGTFFFQLMGVTALVPLFVAVVLEPTVGAGEWLALPRLFALGAGAMFLVYAWPVRVRTRELALVAASVLSAAALATYLRNTGPIGDGLPWVVASLSALGTGLVGGSVGLAMVFGHWYLTIPTLDVAWLVRLNRLTMVWMGLSLAAVLATCAVFERDLAARDIDIFGTWPLFHIGTRVLLGIAMPLLFGWMCAQSLRYRNTRSATGILYASTVLVLIGTAVSIFLQDLYGVPL